MSTPTSASPNGGPLETGEAQRTALRHGAAGGDRRRVLVVEDNVDAAESLRDVLELSKHVVELAFTGVEGLARARAFRPDVVLCDIGLPGMDGYEVARAMRADPDLRGAKLVAITGYAAPADLTRSREAGFDVHLAKPPRLEQLEDILCSVSAAESSDDPGP
jgi:CheY-like chemotaxis protein